MAKRTTAPVTTLFSCWVYFLDKECFWQAGTKVTQKSILTIVFDWPGNSDEVFAHYNDVILTETVVTVMPLRYRTSCTNHFYFFLHKNYSVKVIFTAFFSE